MKYSQFVVWNFVVGSVYVLSIGSAAYGAGKIAANEQDGESLAALVGAGDRGRLRNARGTALPLPPRPQFRRAGRRGRGRRVMARMRQAARAMIGTVTDRANGTGTPCCQRANWTPGFAWSLLESCDNGAAPARAGPSARRPS
jgi:hypothetical protein